MNKQERVFRSKVVWAMRRLLDSIKVWGPEEAGAAFGNAGAESGGFTLFQELKPTVKGSRGGFGWFQWTGPRRRAYGAWCKKNGLDPKSDEANVDYLIVELRTTEKKTVSAVKSAAGIEAKTKAFEVVFERPGVAHTEARVRWARIAMEEWKKSGGRVEASGPKTPEKKPEEKTSIYTSRAMVQVVQARLTELNYPLGSRDPKTGEFDGILGTLSRSAIRDFRADNGLPEGESIDASLVAALDTAKPRELAPARENASTEKAAESAPEIAANWRTEVATKFGAPGLLFLALLDWVTSKFAGGREAIQPYLDLLASIPLWVWLVAGAIVLGLLWWNHRVGRVAGVEAFRRGARL